MCRECFLVTFPTAAELPHPADTCTGRLYQAWPSGQSFRNVRRLYVLPCMFRLWSSAGSEFPKLGVKTFLICLGLAGMALTHSTFAGTFISIRVHAGGSAYTDSLGQTWNADTDFSGGDVYGTASPINNTPDPALYQTERWSAFSYQFAVPNGSYNVVLKFAEIYWNSVGQRVFNVSINGTQVLTNFDIVAAAGAPLTAIDQTFPVTVTNGTVTIQFIPGSADLPKVSAINLVPSSSTSPPVGQLTLSQANFAFGNVYIGTTVSQTFSLSNTGTATITFSGVSVSGAGFSATGVSNGVMLKPGQSITLTATFTPATAAAVTGSVAFTSNAANPSATIVLSGTGVQPTHSVFLMWNPSTSPGVIGYFVYRGAASAGPFTVLNTSPVSTTAYTDTTVQSGQVYYYVVTAVDSSDTQSTYSNVTSATIP